MATDVKRDPVEVVLDVLCGEYPLSRYKRHTWQSTVSTILDAVRAAGLLRDEAREARMREALEETRAYLDGLADDEADEHLMPLIRAALEDKP